MDYINQITPIIIAIFGANNIYITIGIMILGFILKDINLRSFRLNKNLSTIKLSADDNPYRNYDYHKVNWFLLKNYLDKFDNFDCGAKSSGVHKNYTKVDLKITVGLCTNVEIIWNNQKIYITKESHSDDKSTSKHLILTSNNKKILKKLVKTAIIEYKKNQIELRKSTVREVYTIHEDGWKSNKIHINKNMDNVFINKNIKNRIKDTLNSFLKSENLYKKLGIPYKKGYIFHGIPGTGKSSLVYAISSYTKRNIYNINLSTTHGKKLENMITSIPSGSIVAFEDADEGLKDLKRNLKEKSLDNKTNSDNKIDTSNEDDNDLSFSFSPIKLTTILNILDGYNTLHDCIVIMTTNKIEDLDNAIIRPGRIDHKFEINYPDKEVINEMYNYFLNRNVTRKELLELRHKSSSFIINEKLLPQL